MARLLDAACSDRPACWVRVERTAGSAPREVGASMLVDEAAVEGTIGGGHLEFQAIDTARRMLAAGEAARVGAGGADGTGGTGGTGGTPRAFIRTLALGPSLGQCCGGSVVLAFRRIDAAERDWVEAAVAAECHAGTGGDRAGHGALRLRTTIDSDVAPHTRVVGQGIDPARPAPTGATHAPDGDDGDDGDDGPPGDADGDVLHSTLVFSPWHIWVFGAGHVGHALVRILSTLPASVTWVDPRDGQFPAPLPPRVVALPADSPAHEVASIPPGADVIVMTHSHALDFDLCMALLARDDLAWCGVIGSRTKATRFRRRLAQRGIDAARIARLACPIGASAGGPLAGFDEAIGRSAEDKHPGAIALDIAFQLWERRRTARAIRSTRPIGESPGDGGARGESRVHE
jgi:xanthine dehydrogenase accessory factor